MRTQVLASFLAILIVGSFAGSAFAKRGDFREDHPRRAEVLRRNHNLGQQIQADKGHLDGQYTALERQDQRIKRQEQHDAHMNGGYITPSQQHQINREENRLHREIRQDNR